MPVSQRLRLRHEGLHARERVFDYSKMMAQGSRAQRLAPKTASDREGSMNISQKIAHRRRRERGRISSCAAGGLREHHGPDRRRICCGRTASTWPRSTSKSPTSARRPTTSRRPWPTATPLPMQVQVTAIDKTIDDTSRTPTRPIAWAGGQRRRLRRRPLARSTMR